MTTKLTVEQQALLLSWIDDIQKSVLTSWDLKPIEKLTAVSRSLNYFLQRHPDFREALLDEPIGELGPVKRLLDLTNE